VLRKTSYIKHQLSKLIFFLRTGSRSMPN